SASTSPRRIAVSTLVASGSDDREHIIREKATAWKECWHRWTRGQDFLASVPPPAISAAPCRPQVSPFSGSAVPRRGGTASGRSSCDLLSLKLQKPPAQAVALGRGRRMKMLRPGAGVAMRSISVARYAALRADLGVA